MKSVLEVIINAVILTINYYKYEILVLHWH